jgi:peptide deformylase
LIYPIIIYGDPVLKKRAEDVLPGHPELKKLIADMFETMRGANGVGLAAPQIGKSLRIFVADASGIKDKEEEESNPELKNFIKVFINPEIIEESEAEFKYEEGCLSIPGIREEVVRPDTIRIRYVDENFKKYEESYSGIQGRIIQHEYDHLEGILFLEHLSAFKRNLLKGKLSNLSKGILQVDYPFRVPPRKKR